MDNQENFKVEIIENIFEKINSMTFEERYEIELAHTRQLRNNLLKKSDEYMYQFDRFTPEQMEELKIYRQALRDIPSDYKHLINKEKIPFPTPPSFIL